MTTTRKRIITCEECGKEYEVETYDVIDANESPEARELIIHNGLFSFTCPHCHYTNERMYSFFYIDDTNKFKIQFAHKAKLLEYKIPENSEYIEVGCVDSRDLVSKITALENGLDYVTEKLFEVLLQEHMKSMENEEKSNYDLLFLVKNEVGDLGYLYLYKDSNGEVDYDAVNFSYEVYNDVMDEFNEVKTDKFNFYIFDTEAANKFLEHDLYDDENSELAILDTYNGLPIIVKVPDFNIGKFKENDIVIAYDDGDLVKGKVKKVIQSNKKYSLLFEENLPALLYKEKPIILETKEDSNFELVNQELIEMFNNKKKDLDEEIVFNSNIIVGVKYEIPLDGLYNKDGEYVNVKTKIIDTYEENRRYLNIYLESKDVKDDSITKHIYSFNDVINLVLNDPYSFDGLCLISNEQKKFINHEALYRYKKNRIMAITEKMNEFLFNLREHEIEYVGEDNFDLIAYIYSNDQPITVTKEHFNYSDEKIDKMLKDGYHKLGQIAICNY